MKERPTIYMRFLVIAVMAAVMGACASMGRPEGGPRDETPPRYLSSVPSPGKNNVTKPKIEILFDENIKLEDVLNKVVVSPAQKTPPSINASGRKVIVELRDTMRDSTTYTIDFSDAIRDLNEGNILDGFALDFSTGPVVDSLQISGMVLQARNLEPAQGMLVGVYSNLADSAISTLQLERIARTNQLGQFTVRNLKPGTYNIFALNDINRDYHWDRSEDVAFFDSPIIPAVTVTEATDTLKSAAGEDSLTTRTVTTFSPRDILLTWFNEDYKPQYLQDYKRPEDKKLTLRMGAPADSLPTLTIVNGPNAGRTDRQWARLNASLTRDTLEYWITDSAVIKQDSMLVALRYMRTDTLDRLSWATDTLKFFHRPPKTKKKKKDDNDTVPKINFLTFRALSGTQQDLNKPLRFETSQPLDTILADGVNLSIMRDTVWEPVQRPTFIADSTNLMRYTLPYRWEGGGKYRLTVDSAAVRGIYNEWNRPVKLEFTVKNPEDYANLFFKIPDIDRPLVVELLNGSDKPVATSALVNGVATFNFVNPGTYFARAFIDTNANGEWDTGDLKSKRQPEEVYYYPKKLNVRKNWDIEQTWDIYALPLDTQKPVEIKKNKPRAKESDENDTGGEEDEGEFYDGSYTGPGSQYDNLHRSSSGKKSSSSRNPRLKKASNF